MSLCRQTCQDCQACQTCCCHFRIPSNSTLTVIDKSDKLTSHHPSTAFLSDVTSLTWPRILRWGYTVAAASTKYYTMAYFDSASEGTRATQWNVRCQHVDVQTQTHVHYDYYNATTQSSARVLPRRLMQCVRAMMLCSSGRFLGFYMDFVA
jgi:hypothetical protein